MSPTGYFSLSNLRCFRSTAHFRTALSSSFSAQRAENGPARSHPSSGPSADSDSNDGVKRAHVCHHQHCFKAYRQSSGLRYHLRHVKSSLHHEVSFTNLSVGTSGGNARPAQCCSPDCRAWYAIQNEKNEAQDHWSWRCLTSMPPSYRGPSRQSRRRLRSRLPQALFSLLIPRFWNLGSCFWQHRLRPDVISPPFTLIDKI